MKILSNVIDGAKKILISDIGAHYTATNVEDVLQEIGPIISQSIVAVDELAANGLPRDADTLEGHDSSYFATSETYTATIPASSWTGSSAPFSKAVTVNGIQSTDTPFLDVVQTGTYATDQTMLTNWSSIYRAVATTNTITFYATNIPTANINIQIKVII